MPQTLTLDHVSPATRLLEKRRHMFEVQEALDAQKDEFQRKEATFKRREEMLKAKDLALQESLIKFNKFLQENDSKRNRAEKKRVDESRQKALKEHEIERLLAEVEKQKEKRSQMEEEVKKMSQYQTYLDEVLEAEEEYAEITELLSRYETLQAANDDLIDRQHSAALENEEERHLLQTFTREKTDEILGHNNEIAELQKDSEKAAAEVLETQDESDRQMQTVAERTLQLGQVIMACENIYARCVVNSNVVRKEPKSDAVVDETEVIVEKLGLIQDYITDLQSITRNAKPVQTPKAGEPFAAAGSSGASPTTNGQAAGAGGSPPKSISENRSVRESRGGHGESRSRHSIASGSEAGA